MNPDELTTIATFGTFHAAEFAKGLLAANDIEAFLADQEMSRVYLFPLIGGGIKLQVRAEDAEDALSLLRDPPSPDSDSMAY